MRRCVCVICIGVAIVFYGNSCNSGPQDREDAEPRAKVSNQVEDGSAILLSKALSQYSAKQSEDEQRELANRVGAIVKAAREKFLDCASRGDYRAALIEYKTIQSVSEGPEAKRLGLAPDYGPWSEALLLAHLAQSEVLANRELLALTLYQDSFNAGLIDQDAMRQAKELAKKLGDTYSQNLFEGVLERSDKPKEGETRQDFGKILNAVCTIWINRGMKIESGVAVPDRVIGSGFFIDNRGFLLTNYHVIASEVDPTYEGYSRLYIRQSKDMDQKIPAKVIAWDEELDLALLKASVESEYTLSLSQEKKLYPGQRIFAIGSPVGLDSTVTQGIVSAIDRDVMGMGDAVQVDVAVNPGNSGGPLIDDEGMVAGVVFAGLMQYQGLNFAIPSRWLRLVLDRLYQGGRVNYGVIGLVVYDSSAKVGIEYAIKGSGAYEAGARRGDYLLSVDGVPVHSVKDLRALSVAMYPGQLLRLEFQRGEDTMIRYVAARPRDKSPLESLVLSESREDVLPVFFGMEVEGLARAWGGRNYRVLKVLPGSIADEAGFSSDDPFFLRSFRYDKKQKAVFMQLYIKRKKQGFLESIIQLAAPLNAPKVF